MEAWRPINCVDNKFIINILLFIILLYTNILLLNANHCTHHHGPPIPAPKDACVFWLNDANGLREAQIVAHHGVNWTLHGWWPQVIREHKAPPIPYNIFVPMFAALHLNTKFIDMTGRGNCCCSAYREYAKHGADSGYNLTTWLDNVKNCVNIMGANSAVCNVHQCRYDHHNKCNMPQSCSIGAKLDLVGCREGVVLCGNLAIKRNLVL